MSPLAPLDGCAELDWMAGAAAQLDEVSAFLCAVRWRVLSWSLMSLFAPPGGVQKWSWTAGAATLLDEAHASLRAVESEPLRS